MSEPSANIGTTYYSAIDSSPLSVRAALKALHNAIALSPDDADRVEIAMAEVLNNIVEHAYAEEPGHLVEMWANRAPDHLIVRIEDAGHPLPEEKLPDGSAAEVAGDVDTLPEGGFGWFMIRALASDIAYIRDNGRNCLTVRFELAV